MDFARTFGITSVFLLVSLFFAATERRTGITTPRNEKGKGGAELMNKSPCLREEVYECQASGGTYNWSHCICE